MEPAVNINGLTGCIRELTGAKGVNISAQNLPLENSQSIYMDLNSLLLLDESTVES